MTNYTDRSDMSIIAGDDFTPQVELTENGEAADPEDIDTVELIIHSSDGEHVYPRAGNDGNVYSFYVSGEDTLALADETDYGFVELCVRVTRANGSRVTPIHRLPVAIRRC